MKAWTIAMMIMIGTAEASTVDIIASRDTTIYSDLTATPLSNGSGQYFFAGEVGENDNYNFRRALFYFDVAANVPAGMTIISASLRVYVNQRPLTANLTDPFSLHAALQAWGEGASDPSGPEGGGASAQTDDATWFHTFYPGSTWTTAGGDFAATASASLNIGNPGPYDFSDAQMLADAQTWLDTPAANYGWFLLGDESTAQSTRRFYSRESGEDTAATLTLGFDIVPEPRGLWILGSLLLLVARRYKFHIPPRRRI